MIRGLLCGLILLMHGVDPACLYSQALHDENWPYQNYPTGPITVPSWRYAHGPHVRAAFRKVVTDAREATVEIHVDGRKQALGGIIDSAGWVITKASALGGEITCSLSDGRELEAREFKRNSEFDIALLKLEATDLPALKLEQSAHPEVGSWLATVGADSYPLGVGIVSVEPRKIAHQAGVLGIQLDSTNEPARIVRVFPGSAASKAGLLTNDVLLSINGVSTDTREELVEQVQRFNPGDSVRLSVERRGNKLELKAVLMGRFPGLPSSRAEFQNQLGGDLSERRFGFPSAFQHDTVIEPADCGGPVVNLAGNVVGFNIARSGRTETYAIAADSIQEMLSEMLPGARDRRANASVDPTGELSGELKTRAATPLVSPAPATVP